MEGKVKELEEKEEREEVVRIRTSQRVMVNRKTRKWRKKIRRREHKELTPGSSARTRGPCIIQ